MQQHTVERGSERWLKISFLKRIMACSRVTRAESQGMDRLAESHLCIIESGT